MDRSITILTYMLYLAFPSTEIRVTDGSKENLNSDLHFLRWIYLHLFYHQRLPWTIRYSSCNNNKTFNLLLLLFTRRRRRNLLPLQLMTLPFGAMFQFWFLSQSISTNCRALYIVLQPSLVVKLKLIPTHLHNIIIITLVTANKWAILSKI